MTDVYFVRTLRVVIFTLFYCLLGMSCGKCNAISLYFQCCSVNGSVCLVCCVFDIVCELFGETIHNIFGCGCYFIVECYGGLESGWRCSVGYTLYGLLKNACAVLVIPVRI